MSGANSDTKPDTNSISYDNTVSDEHPDSNCNTNTVTNTDRSALANSDTDSRSNSLNLHVLE